VQRVREAASRARCANNLKQLGVAMHNYHGVYDSFPPGYWTPNPAQTASIGGPGQHSWAMYILPYIEQVGLFQKYNWNVGFRGVNYVAVNGGVFSTRISTYICPSDTTGIVGNDPSGCNGFSRSNYVTCVSPDGSLMEKGITTFDATCNNAHNPATKSALFNWNVIRAIRDVTDGTSNTVALSEQISGPDGTVDLRGMWFDNLGNGYSHLRTPNSSIPDQILGSPYCVSTTMAPCNGSAPCWEGEIYAARSFHAGGVNACLADGSVRFFANSIGAQLWINLASINGGEVLTGDY
jgi:prepilin-type processing-associated H-X9-DG protein